MPPRYRLNRLQYIPWFVLVGCLGLTFLLQTWIFDWHLPTTDEDLETHARMVLFVGSFISFVVYAIVYVLMSNRNTALQLAFESTQQLTQVSSLQHAILNSVKYAIVSVDGQGVIRHFNRTAEAEFGLRADDMIGSGSLSQLFEPVPALSEMQQKEWLGLTHDGRRVPFLLSVTPQVDAKGANTGFVLIANNISAQKKAEHIKSTRMSITETLARSETSHGALPTVLSILGSKLGFDACAFWTYREDADSFKKDYQWANSRVQHAAREDIDRSGTLIHQVAARLRETRRPLEILARDAEELKIFESAYLVPLQTGDGVRGCCTLYSLKARPGDESLMETLHEIGLVLGQFQKRLGTEQALRESEERFKAFMENSPVAAYIKSEAGQVVYINEHGAKSFGLHSTEILDQKIEAILPETMANPLLAIEAKVWDGQRTVSELCHMVDQRGRENYWMMFQFLLKAQNGKRFVGAISIDVTEQKRIEAEIIEARRVAEEANQSKSEFLANVSHEVRTPMNGIIGMAELLLRTELAAEQRDYLNMMMFSADNLLSIVNDILDYSKIDAGKLDLEVVSFNLQDLVGAVVRPLYPKAYDKGIEFFVEYEKELPDQYLGDPLRISQVLINLISNAIKFTEEGRVVLSLSTRGQLHGLQILEFAVTDTGIGISADKQSIIFDAFSQADGSTSRYYGGSGLGLTISSRLVHKMGSAIEVRSEVGQGSTFSFAIQLPVEASETHEKKVGAETIAIVGPATRENAQLEALLLERGMIVTRATTMNGLAAGSYHTIFTDLGQAFGVQQATIRGQFLKPLLPYDIDEALLGKMQLSRAFRFRAEELQSYAGNFGLKVLLAEDNIINQTLALRLLERKGCHVTLAKNGLEAVAAAQTESFDLILMDIQMPGMGGIEATREIRKEKRNAYTSIAAMTAHAMRGDREKFLAAGMDAYLSKPIRIDELFDLVSTIAAQKYKSRPKLVHMDDAKFLDSLGGDVGLMRELLEKFLANAPKNLDLLEKAIAAGNFEDMELYAHKIKGSLAMLEAVKARDLAQGMEDSAERKQNVDPALFAELRTLCEAIYAEASTCLVDQAS